MSAFITKEDYASIINENLLDDLTEVDDDKIDACENRAVELISDHLSNRYNVDEIFNKTGDDRNKVILGLAMDITIYYLHRISNWRNCPSARAVAFKEATDWLEKVNTMKINPRELPLITDGTKDFIIFGGNDKRQNHI